VFDLCVRLSNIRRKTLKILSYKGNYGDRIGIEIDRGIVDFSASFQLYNLVEKEQICPMITDIMELIEGNLFDVDIFADLLIFLERHSFLDRYIVPGKVKINPPITKPSKIVALGLNYADHAKESGRESPKEPIIFCKASTSIIGPEDNVVIKPNIGRVDPEVEFAVIIGRRARNVPKSEAGYYIAGYTVLNDISARDIQSADFALRNPWFRSKSMDTFCPIGPYIVLTDEISPEDELDLEMKVNGEVRQKSNTRQLIFKVTDLIEYISSIMTLEPGDIISTGTPEGIAPIHPGDIMEATVEKIGTLRNYVRFED
jgi:5-oxopent-3-ene-1,2,5-tricarboxylate decarboxylase/2-hydroxyhepta-2,4-diene-1,7-dioate isomerase